MQSPYTEDYYLRGKSAGLSNYENYSWKPEATVPFAGRLVEVLGIQEGEEILDFGCSRGYLVKALRQLGIKAWGHDISEWAIENCDPEVVKFVGREIPNGPFHHIIAKDTLEHLESIVLMRTADLILKLAQVSILIMVPLTERVGGQYVRKEDDMDITHKIRWPLEDWMEFFRRRIPGEEWVLQGSWHIPSLKPTSLSHPKSCGFILLTRA